MEQKSGSSGSSSDLEVPTDPEDYEKYKKAIIKQKRVLRRYMRLKRNNFVKNHEAELTDNWYIKQYVPKFEQILKENREFLNFISEGNKHNGSTIEISSYNPITYECNITPVVSELIKANKELNLNLSLPVVVEKGEPLEFREYKEGDHLEKSHLFEVLEPTPDKKRVYPQVIIVPLMGFMDDCHRIGYGGGFYDRSIH